MTILLLIPHIGAKVQIKITTQVPAYLQIGLSSRILFKPRLSNVFHELLLNILESS